MSLRPWQAKKRSTGKVEEQKVITCIAHDEEEDSNKKTFMTEKYVYSGLIKKIYEPKDEEKSTVFADHGYKEARISAGVRIPKGHWVYIYPNWFVWENKRKKPLINIKSKLNSNALLHFSNEHHPQQEMKTANGKYSGLITEIHLPNDIVKYTAFFDYGYCESMNYGGVSVSKGYWVYTYPKWYVWKKKYKSSFRKGGECCRGKKKRISSKSRLKSANGKYSNLIQMIYAPEDKAVYSEIADEEFWDASTYAGCSQPAGYWVYVYPHWYIWGNKNLTEVELDVFHEKVSLKNGELDVSFQYNKNNKEWARRMLTVFSKTLPLLEELSGLPYPGVKPYLIYEDPLLRDCLGRGGPLGMAIASPPKAMEWTLLHEMVHIWNAHGKPMWVCEGLADFISYRLMIDLDIAFVQGETLSNYIELWRQNRDAGDDSPLNENSADENVYANQRGKGMEYWQILYERFGDAVLNVCFKKNSVQGEISLSEFQDILRSLGEKDPIKFIQGWLTKGDYYIVQCKGIEFA